VAFKSLIPLWLFSQLFWYQYMTPDLSINVGLRIPPDRLLFVLLSAMFVTSVRNRPRLDLIEGCMVLFTVMSTVSLIVTGADADGIRLRWLTTLFQLTYFPFSIYYVAKHGQYTIDEVKTLLKWLLAIQTYLVVSGVLEHYRIDALVWPKYILDENIGDQWERLRGPFMNSSFLGAALVMTFAASSVMALYVRGIRSWLLHCILLLTGICVYFTYTRTVWLGFFATLIIFVFTRTGLNRVSGRVLCAILLAFLVGAGSKFSLSSSTLFGRRQNTVEYRIANISLAYKVFLAHPILGLGYGRFGKELRMYEEAFTDDPETALTSGNENTVFGLLTELGLVGFSLYAMIVFLALRSCVRAYRNLPRSETIERALPVVGGSMLTYFCLNSMTGDLRFHLFTHNIMFLILGVSAGMTLQRSDLPRVKIGDELQSDVESGAALAPDTEVRPT